MRDPEQRQRIKAFFETLDEKNRGIIDTGNVDKGLLNLIYVPEGSDSRAIEELRKTSKQLSKDLVELAASKDSGNITLQDFEGFALSREKDLWVLFNMIKQDYNAIDIQALRKAFETNNIIVPENEIQDFFRHIDADKDGLIQFNEWRDFFLLSPHKPTLKNVISFFDSLSAVDYNSDAQVSEIRYSDFFVGLQYFLAGGIAGAISRTATAPFDRLKVLLQTQTYKTRIPMRDAYIKAVTRIYQNGGLLSFYRGNGLNIIKIFPESALKFFTFEYMKKTIAANQNLDDHRSLTVGERFFAGGMAGLLSQFAIYPIETVKTRIMSQITYKSDSVSSQMHKELNVNSTIRNLWKENGIKAFYRGCLPSLVGIIPYAGVDLAVFETLKSAFMSTEGNSLQQLPTHMVLAFGMISGTSGAVLMYPLSLIRTRLQAQGTPSHPTFYTGSFDVIKKTLKNEGILGFYKGIAPTLAKVVPAVSISYVIYEHTKRLFRIQ